jgi:outer membrane protein assembly factor BamB
MQRTLRTAVLASFALLCLLATPLFAQTPDGAAVFAKACTSCHVNPAADSRAPWSKAASEKLCGTARGCSAAQGAAVTAIAGIVFSGSMDGGIRAYSSTDGTIVWQFDTKVSIEQNDDELVRFFSPSGAALRGCESQG